MRKPVLKRRTPKRVRIKPRTSEELLRRLYQKLEKDVIRQTRANRRRLFETAGQRTLRRVRQKSLAMAMAFAFEKTGITNPGIKRRCYALIQTRIRELGSLQRNITAIAEIINTELPEKYTEFESAVIEFLKLHEIAAKNSPQYYLSAEGIRTQRTRVRRVLDIALKQRRALEKKRNEI